MKTRLIMFDFDGTLTNKDSMLGFAKFYHGNFNYLTGMLTLLPVLMLYKIKLIPNWRAKEYFLTRFFGNEPIDKFQEIGDRFALEKIPAMLRKGAMQQLADYQQNGDQLVIVSSSAENWLRAWCQQMTIPLISTKLQVKNNLVVGKIEGVNCYGKEKVNRLKEVYNLEDFEEVIVYGDSKGDFDLFKIATRYYYKPFRN